jgi:hypothetical protein
MHETYLDKLCKSQIRALLFLKFVLAVELVRAIGGKGGKERDVVTEDVGDSFDDSVQLLMLVQCVVQARIDGDHVVDVPEHLLDEVCATMFRYDIQRVERCYPDLMYVLISMHTVSKIRTHTSCKYSISHTKSHTV